MSENGVMDRPRRTTRSSLASSSGGAGTPGTPVNSSNPYKKPTYFSNTRGGAGETPPSSRTSNGTPASSGRGRRGRGRPPGRSSMSRGGAHTKPECVAVRVDGRRSTGGSTASSAGGRRGAASGGRRSTYTSRHDYEYHYGSDFESDQNESELEEEIESEQEETDGDSVSIPPGDNDNAESDSDVSESSNRVSSRLPSPPVPIWLDTEKVPEIPMLELPSSSDDLLLSRENVVKAVEVYEPLRRFQQLVRISPFRFEDFCAALASKDQSSLLAEIHIQLLRSVIREEDANGTLFGPNEVKDSIHTVVYFIDHITWPESLRSYLESDRTWKDVYDALISVEYPFCEPAIRIKVLGLLVDQFLTTNVVRVQLLGDGSILHEDHCRACNRLGELICCETCPAVYHLECITPPLKDLDNPPDDWKCSVCMKHQIPGVNDCTSEVERMGLLVRHERLGYDRHGRKYWFLVRRILVESEDGSEVWYYSTRKQLEDLLETLDADNYESTLISNIKAIEEEIYRQMEITEEVTRQQNTLRRRTYLEVEGGKENEGKTGAERMTRLKSTGLYKLGEEGLFRTYINYFTTDPAALSKGKNNEERDRKRHMSHKFSLTTASECKYGIKDIQGCPRSVQVTALKNALTHMEAVLPTTLMHVNWPMLRKSWLASVQAGNYPVDFSRAMIMISSCIRNAVYNPVWSESTGHVRLCRMSLMEREEKKKAEKRDKKDKDDEEDRLKAVPQFIKYTLPIRHQVYKQKGEEYRIHGRWGWLWLSNMRRCKSQDCREMGLLAGPHKHVIQVKNETGKVKTMLIDPSVYCKLMAKRSMAVSSTGSSVSNTPSSNDEPVVTSVQCESSSDKESSSNSNGIGCSPDGEVKEESAEEKKATEKSFIDDVKEEGGQEGEESTAVVVMETDKEKEIELKEEPMDVNEKEATTDKDLETDVPSVLNGPVKEDEVSKEENTDKEELKESECKVASPVKEQEIMEVDKTVEDNVQHEKRSEMELEKSIPEEKFAMNGSVEPMDDSSESEKENKIADISEPQTQVLSSSSPAQADKEEPVTPSPATLQPQPPSTPSVEKGAGEEGRKYRTELVNVSSGLTSTHRILFPKVAKRCDYLDNLLQRKLTLHSLEEKTLKAEFGDEMVLNAKKGIAEFEEEERKRAQEAEEFPGEEKIDVNLTLGGAYAFACYSSECRKEALLFMKTKGKNRERLYEKVCYSPMCRLKFCLQETVRMKQDKIRERENERHYKIYKEIEAKRVYTAEKTSQKTFIKKIPDCIMAILIDAGSTLVAPGTTLNKNDSRKKKAPAVKYPQVSSFQYAASKKPSILVLAPYELKKLARTSGRTFTPSGFFPNQKSGSWGWSLPCGRPVFRTAWQYKTTHARTLGAAAMQLRILYSSIRWDDILAKIPNTEGKHQVHTDTEIITTEILNHRIVGRFMERVQYLRKMMVVPIDAPKTIREITPSRIGLRKRKRAESPDKTEPVVSEDWVDEEKLELWEIRYYGDRIDRRNERRSEGGATPSASTRTRSGIAIKQPEKYDPSHNSSPSGEKKSYPAHPQKENQVGVDSTAVAVSGLPSDTISDKIDNTIDAVVRNHNPDTKQGALSAIKTAELMRETLETEMKMQRSAHVSKREKHGNVNGSKQVPPTPQPTASQQFQQQLQQGLVPGVGNSGALQKNIAQVVAPAINTSKVGGLVVGKKFFANRQANAMNTAAGLDTGILTKRPMQNTITINKGVGGNISIVKNPVPQHNPQPAVTQQAVPVAVSAIMTTVSNSSNTVTLSGQQVQASQIPQRLSVLRMPDGRVHVKGLLEGQQCFQTADGKIHVSVTPAHVQQLQRAQQAAKAAEGTQVPVTVGMDPTPVIVSDSGTTPVVSTSASVTPVSALAVNPSSAATLPATSTMTFTSGIQVQQQVGTSQQPVINISNQAMRSNISSNSTTVPIAGNKPVQQQQVIVQQQDGRQLIFQGAAAQAILQQQQQKLASLQQQRVAIQQSSVGSVQSKVGPVGGLKNPVIVSTSSVASASTTPTPVTVPGRIIIQDGKAILISDQQQSPQQQRNLIISKPVVQTSVSQSPSARPQVIQTNSQGQVVQNQGIQLIQSGQQLHIISQQGTNPSGQQFVIQQQSTAESSTVSSPTIATSAIASTNAGTLITSAASSASDASAYSPMKGTVTVSTPTATPTTSSVGTTPMAVKHVLPDGRQIWMAPNQLNDFGGRKIVLNKQVVQQPVTTSQPTIQIVRGPGGQQFVIQQPAGTPPLLQQQLQIIMSSGGQFGGQPLLLKKFVKGSPQAGTPTKQGNVVQIPATAQNQLAQLLGPNKALLRLDNNQLAAIQLPVQQQQQTSSAAVTPVATSTSPQVVATKSPVVVAPAATISQPSTPVPTTPQQSQNQTTITRTPGLPISIVSPSKSKVQQGSSQQKSTNVQVISSSGSSLIATATSTSLPAAGVSSAKTPTVMRVASPNIVRGSGSTPSTTVVRSPAPVVISSPRPLISNSPQPPRLSQSPVKSSVSTPVFATKSAPPPLPSPAQQISTPPVVHQVSSVSSTSVVALDASVITATKTFPAPVPQEEPLSQATCAVPIPNTEQRQVTVPAAAKPVAVPAAGTPNAAVAKQKLINNKIVAQIFQTPQGPKVVIQGVSPGDLTPHQIMQLQQQIHKSLAAQQEQKTTLALTKSVASPAIVSSPATPGELQQTPTISGQTPVLHSSSSLTNAQQSSPIETLRSGSSTPVTTLPSALSSPIMARSPPPPSMVSPAKILSPSPYIPSMLSSSKASARQEMSEVGNSQQIDLVPAVASPPVIARKSAPRKSPIKTNNLDSPPQILSPLPPAVVQNSRGMNSVAAELMQPLNAEQQQILAEKRNALKEEIMEKKKAAATQMRLEAQREMQLKLEKAREIQVANTAETPMNNVPPSYQNNAVNEVGGGVGHGGRGKKRKMKTNSRNSTDGGSSVGASSSSRKGAGGGKRKRKLFCICETPYDKDKFYVGCDKCDNWFHGDCVGITEEMSKDLQEYICDDCRDDKLYCLCKKPYNESQFYIQCDKCEDWFHGRCVGVLQGESDSIGDYSCPACEPNSEINAPNYKQLDASDYAAVNRLLMELLANRSSNPFKKPVTKAQAPGYYTIIKEPMDLQQICNRVEKRQYERLRDFVGDLVKIFENCRYFNDSTSEIFRHADTLEKFLVHKIWALRRNFNTRVRQGIQ